MSTFLTSAVFCYFLLIFLMNSSAKFHHDGMIDVFRLMKGCGFRPSKVLDIGANVGSWTAEMKGIFPEASFFMIEGNENHRGSLQNVGSPFEITLVGKVAGNATFYKSRKDAAGTGNSVFKENTDYFCENCYDKIVLPIQTPDAVVVKNLAGPFQLLKIGVQGAEVDALLGATETLKSVEVIYTECSLMNYNHGAPAFLDLYVLLDYHGFAFYTVANHYYKDGLCLQFDAFFVRKSSALWNQSCTHFPPPAYFNNTKNYFDVFPH